MNQATKDCLNALINYNRDLEEEKDNFKANEEAAIALWVAMSGGRVTAAHKKAIKTIAKKIATDKLEELEDDIKAQCSVLEDSEKSYGIQLSLFTKPLQDLKDSLGEGEQIELSFDRGSKVVSLHG